MINIPNININNFKNIHNVGGLNKLANGFLSMDPLLLASLKIGLSEAMVISNIIITIGANPVNTAYRHAYDNIAFIPYKFVKAVTTNPPNDPPTPNPRLTMREPENPLHLLAEFSTAYVNPPVSIPPYDSPSISLSMT